jgi:opacity protein-like surface antigen
MKFLSWIFLLLLFFGTKAWAQEDQKIEVSVNFGWTAADGVSGDHVLAADGNFYNAIDPKDAFSWCVTGEYFLTDNIELGFLYDDQKSKLEVTGTAKTQVADMDIRNFHGIFSYNLGEKGERMRPFLFFGIGGTHYSSVDVEVNGVRGTIDGNTKASATLGGGIKYYATRNVGLRLQGRWTPTYITTNSNDGWWCDPFYGCYVVSGAQYSNQFEFTAGVNLHF